MSLAGPKMKELDGHDGDHNTGKRNQNQPSHHELRFSPKEFSHDSYPARDIPSVLLPEFQAGDLHPRSTEKMTTVTNNHTKAGDRGYLGLRQSA
jgi:hypothetical protein